MLELNAYPQSNIRNIAIIAHVDHGKTTLVDAMLKQTSTFEKHESEMSQTTIMDSNELERERGVTILAKNTSVFWKDYKINILDTPGHSDFSGEVERILNMADGCVLLVDSAEGVLSQTRYVLGLALKKGLKPIVLVNKVDRKDQRTEDVIEEINNLFLDLAIEDDQLNFPVLYGIGRDGIAGMKTETTPEHSLKIIDSTDLTPLFQTITDFIQAPKGTLEGNFQVQITSLDYDSYKGRYMIGRINRGTVNKGDQTVILRKDVAPIPTKVEHLFTFKGLHKVEINSASVGDIIALTGFSDAKIGDTLSIQGETEILPDLDITPPTVQIHFIVSNSPFVGRDGKLTTSRQIQQRLAKELETNVGLRITSGASADTFVVSGRGELHLSILIETMRREGFEFSVSRPEVIFKEIDGVMQEPWERLTIEVPQEHIGTVTTSLGQRAGTMLAMNATHTGTKLEFEIATRNTLGLRGELLTATSGGVFMHSYPVGYKKKGNDLPKQRSGVIISSEMDQETSYALANLQERGETFVNPGEDVYGGMIVGRTGKKDDIVMNTSRLKKATNVRSNADVLVRLAPAVKFSLEQSLTFLESDELLEVTPNNLRLRKRDLKKASQH